MPISASTTVTSVGVAIGLDLGGTKCLGVAVDQAGQVLAEHRVPTPGEDGEQLLDAMAVLVGEIAAAVGDLPSSVGVGAPGLVDADGVLRFAPNLPGATGLPIAGGLSRRLGLPVQVENDVTCAAFAEWKAGAAMGFSDVLLAALGTGIGGGLVVGGQLARGTNGFAGEIGHMVVDPHGPPCPCGQRGCWERYASGAGLARLAQEAVEAGSAPEILALAGSSAQVRGEHVMASARAGDDGALAVLGTFSWWLALGLANLTNLLDPACIVVGGGLVEDLSQWLDATRAAYAGLVVGAHARPEVPIVPAQLGARAGAVGAALVAQRRELGGEGSGTTVTS